MLPAFSPSRLFLACTSIPYLYTMKKLLSVLLGLLILSCNSKKDEKTSPAHANTDTGSMVTQPTPAPQPEPSFDSYCNSRFQYCIDYPKDTIYPQPESPNGDGRVFKNKNGDKVLTVYGRWAMNTNGDDMTIKQQYDEDLQGGENPNGNERRTITYNKLGRDYFVISGYEDKKIFYQKTILKNGAFCYAILRYNESDKALYDKVSERIFNSFK